MGVGFMFEPNIDTERCCLSTDRCTQTENFVGPQQLTIDLTLDHFVRCFCITILM